MGVKVDYLEGLQFEAYVEGGNGYGVLLDTSKEAGGSNEGIKPTDLLLISLAGCTSMDIISILKKKKQDIAAYSVRVSGERATEHPKVFTKINIIFEIKGKDIEETAVKRAIELSKDRYCTIWAMLCKAALIEWTYRINE